jgi:hypothetical protein
MQKTPTLTTADLAGFTGSETQYVNPLFKYRYTEGVRFLAERGRAWWLLDAIASWQIKLRRRKDLDFQVWTLRRTPAKGVNSAELICTDGNEAQVVKQRINHTDFPLEEIKIYWIEGVMLLPSEY